MYLNNGWKEVENKWVIFIWYIKVRFFYCFLLFDNLILIDNLIDN